MTMEIDAQLSVASTSSEKNDAAVPPRELRGRMYGDWKAVESGWRLFDETSPQSIFQSASWFRNLVQTSLNPGDKVRVYGVEDSRRPGSALVLLPTCHGDTQLLAPRILSSPTNFYTPLFAPMTSPNCDRAQTLQVLAKTIFADSPVWDAINLRWLDKSSPMFDELVESFKSAGYVVQTYFCSGNWFEPIMGRDYQEYLQGLRSSVRNIAKSKLRKVERTGRVRMEILAEGDALEAGIRNYELIYNASWKIPEPYPQFMPGLLQAFARAGWLRLGMAYVDEIPAAAQVWFIANGIASIYKMAYNQGFRDLSIGSCLTMRMMQNAIDVEKVTEIDYLTGDDRYKQDWMSHRRERWGILAMNPRTLGGAVTIVRHVGGRAVKRTVQRILKRFRSTKEEKARPAAAVVNPKPGQKD
jgi:CelD/BcsL family acetyltransferase involved in cellulose biosynthesis